VPALRSAVSVLCARKEARQKVRERSAPAQIRSAAADGAQKANKSADGVFMVVKAITRRGLLKILPALAASPLISHVVEDGQLKSAAVKITPKFYILFFDVEAIDLDGLAQVCIPVPDVEMELIPVRLRYGQKLDDAVKIYQVSGPLDE
jgi:hypothetical protein